MLKNKYILNVITFSIWLLSALPFGNGFSGFIFAQNYPVQITTQLAPPFSGFIPDYSTPGNQNLKLLVVFTDFTKPVYNIKLKIQITGQGINIQSKSYYFSGPTTLQPGIPLEISGSDLSGLLSSANLDFSGITAQQCNTNALPEGFYNICFTAYDYSNLTPIQVSNQSCAYGWMVLSDPPFLNLPICGSTASVTTPQSLMFQWTPMNQISPNSVNSTLYDFALYEIRPGTQNPGNIIQTLPPIYEVTTPFTFVNYGIIEPQLYYGMEYVWRVRARDQSNRDLFKNQGYSQQCTFIYGSALSQLDSNSIKLNLQGTTLTYRLAKYTWDSLSIFTSYQLEYRKQGGVNWFPINSTSCRSIVNNLEPENTYEARVRGLFSEGNGPWSNVVTITTPAKPVIVCGQGAVAPMASNFIPLTTGKTSQIWNIGQFDMLVTQLDNPNNPNGKYTGYGKITIPFMLGLNLRGKFTNISVNEAMEVVQGEVEIVSSWQNGNGIINLDTLFTGISNAIADVIANLNANTLDSSSLADFNTTMSSLLANDSSLASLQSAYDSVYQHLLDISTTAGLGDPNYADIKDAINELKQLENQILQTVENSYSNQLSSCNPDNVPPNIKALAQRAINCDSEVDNEAVAYSETVFKTLCIDQRVNLIKCIADGTAVPDEDEKTIIALIKTTPNNQIKELFSRLEENQSELLLKLISVVSDVDEDNYSSMMLSFVELFQKRDMGMSLETVYWGIINESTYYEASNVQATFQNNGRLKLQGVYTYKTQNTGNIWGPEYTQLNHDNVSPFVPINFTFIGLPVQSSVGNGFQVGKSYKVPALFVYFIRDKVWKGIMQAVAWDAVQLATAPTALGEIEAAKGLWKAFSIVVAVGNSGGYILNSLPISSQINTTAEGREFLFWYNRCLMIANVGYISPFAYKFSKKLVQSYPLVKNKLQSILSQNEFKKVDDAVNEVAGSVVNSVNLMQHIDIQESLSVIQELKNTNKLSLGVGSATDIELAAIHRYTANGDFLNLPMRQQNGTLVLDEFASETFQAITNGLEKLRQTNRLYTQHVYRGRTFSLTEYNDLFNSGKVEIPLKGFVSASKNKSVAIDFISTTANNLPGNKVKCILKIKSTKGVDIDDISDWGVNLVSQKHPGNQAQLEVLLEEGYFKPIGSPKPILENGIPKLDADGITPWIEIELEELVKSIR